MDIETLIYVVLVAVYIMVAVVRKVAKKNIDAIKTQERPTGQRPTVMPDPFTFAPSAPDPFAMSNDAEHDGEEYIPTPTAFEKARRTFEMPQDDVFADMPSAPSFTEEATTLGREHFAAADEPTLYPGYSYKPIDIPEPMAEDESPLRPVERRAEPSSQTNDTEALHPVLADIQANGFDPVKAVLYAEIITPRHNYF